MPRRRSGRNLVRKPILNSTGWVPVQSHDVELTRQTKPSRLQQNPRTIRRPHWVITKGCNLPFQSRATQGRHDEYSAVAFFGTQGDVFPIRLQVVVGPFRDLDGVADDNKLDGLEITFPVTAVTRPSAHGALEALNGMLLFGLTTAILFVIIHKTWGLRSTTSG